MDYQLWVIIAAAIASVAVQVWFSKRALSNLSGQRDEASKGRATESVTRTNAFFIFSILAFLVVIISIWENVIREAVLSSAFWAAVSSIFYFRK